MANAALRMANAELPESAARIIGRVFFGTTSAAAFAGVALVATLPLGMMPGLPFDSFPLTLEVGETLILFTDGVNESMNVQNKQFEMEGVERVIKSAGDVSPRVLGEKLVAAVKQHAAGRDAFDDLTVVVVGRRS